MSGARIFLALSHAADIDKLRSFLLSSGYEVIDYASDGSSAIRKIRALRPDTVMVDIDLPGLSGLEIAKIVEEDGICPAIIIKTADQRENLLGDELWDFAYIVRPISKAAIVQTVNLVITNYRKIQRLVKEIEDLKLTIEARKVIEKAKGIMMDIYGLGEKEAFRRMQKQSMDKGIPMKEIGEAIILAYEIGR